MKFKSDRIRDEYAKLPFKNMPLFDIITRLNEKTVNDYGKEITLTSILRTKEENDALYANVAPDKRPQAAPHLIWGAVDVRSSDFTPAQIAAITDWANKTFKNPSGKLIAIYHCIPGNAPHWHFQYTTPIQPLAA